MSSDIDNTQSKGQVKQWSVLSPTPKIDYFVGLQQDEANLSIYLRPVDFEGRYLKVSFDNALSCRNSQEGVWFNSVDPIDKELWGATFYVVQESAFVRQFHEYSSRAFDDWNITHYAIFTSNFCVDVLSSEEPSVSWETEIPIKE